VWGEAACTLDRGVEDDPHKERRPRRMRSEAAPNTTLGQRI